MRARLRSRANRFFVRRPAIGRWGYELLRRSGVDRSTRGATALCRKLAAQGFRPAVILDVGANYGGWSRAVQRVFPEARFVLVEPQEEMRPFLESFCASSPGSRYYLAGAGAQAGQLELTIWDDLQGSAFLSPQVQEMVPFQEQRQVPVLTIDGLVAAGEMPVPDLIKLDVQNFEMEVLQGGIGCLGRTQVYVIETSFLHPLGYRPSYYRLVELMEAYGYRIYDLFAPSYRSADGALAQVDICFVRGQDRAAPPRPR